MPAINLLPTINPPPALLNYAAIVGATTTTSSRLWFRVAVAGDWTLVLSTAGLAAPITRTHSFDSTTDLTHTFVLAGLSADTTYRYWLTRSDADAEAQALLGEAANLHFRTMQENANSITFGFFSCHDPLPGNGIWQSVWDELSGKQVAIAPGKKGVWKSFFEELEKADARFVIGGGDQIYTDSQDDAGFPWVTRCLKKNAGATMSAVSLGQDAKVLAAIRELYRWFYRVSWSEKICPEMRNAFSRLPHYMMWDDHDIMDGWGSVPRSELRLAVSDPDPEMRVNEPGDGIVNAMWEAARCTYFEYQHSRNPDTGATPSAPVETQWDYCFEQGPAAFYVLDMRGHHDMEKDQAIDPNLLLGQAQMDRFHGWLLADAGATSDNAKVIFVVSPVPLVNWEQSLLNFGSRVPDQQDDVWDEWSARINWGERQRLMDGVFAFSAQSGKPVVFLSGDVHCASVFQLEHAGYKNARVFQLISSGITRLPNHHGEEIADKGQLTGYPQVSYRRLRSPIADQHNALIVSVTTGGPAGPGVEANWVTTNGQKESLSLF